MRAAALLLILTVPIAPGAALQGPSSDHGTILQKFLEAEEETLASYKAIRRMTASTRGGRMQASLEAITSLDQVNGFRYQVLSEEGSGIIRRKVLVAALEAEKDAFHSAEASGARLNTANYDFLAVTAASENLYKIDIRPRRKHEMLIDGALFVDGESADLIRMEGELSKRPSFWTRRVRIVREYARVDGVHVPVSMQSTADVFIVGSSSFSMTYRYTEINGHPVSGDKPAAGLQH